MEKVEARSEIFWLAFQSLPKKEKHKVVSRLLQDAEFMEDLMDIAIAEKRGREPARPFAEYLAKQPKRRKIP